MNVDVRHFNDVNQHARAIPGWAQDYDQLGRGALSSSLQQVSTGHFLVFRERFNRQVVQCGRCPDQRLCLAVSEAMPEPASTGWSRHPLSQVVLLRNREEFMLHAPQGLSLLAANVDYERFLQIADLHLSPEQRALARGSRGLAVGDAAVLRLRQALQQVLAQAGTHEPNEAQTGALDCALDDLVLNAFLDLFDAVDHARAPTRCGGAVRSYIVRRSRELMEEGGGGAMSVLELCARLRVSRRTLQISFQTEAGIGPLEYQRNLRLNAVRRRLGQTTAQALPVGDAAAEMGFFHLSHFARHYRELFGELPSDTLRADGRPTVAWSDHRALKRA
ncbi:helix-turn-helix domain-containing protein [Hydrogenophaga flava]|uniref:helix-turn-helix domain-containing protein n=1 Tax=Hydrogenophaga flava TaxID=65657 RepID=UPI000825D33C|nr:helix-turn-helix domain-containing protein [Hydrogenophaga flava]